MLEGHCVLGELAPGEPAPGKPRVKLFGVSLSACLCSLPPPRARISFSLPEIVDVHPLTASCAGEQTCRACTVQSHGKKNHEHTDNPPGLHLGKGHHEDGGKGDASDEQGLLISQYVSAGNVTPQKPFPGYSDTGRAQWDVSQWDVSTRWREINIYFPRFLGGDILINFQRKRSTVIGFGTRSHKRSEFWPLSTMPLSTKMAAEAAAEGAAQQAKENPRAPPPSQEAAIMIQRILASAKQASLVQQAAPKIPPELMQQQQASGMNDVQQMYPGMAQHIFGATAGSNSVSGSSLTFSPSAPSKFTPSRSQVERLWRRTRSLFVFNDTIEGPRAPLF